MFKRENTNLINDLFFVVAYIFCICGVLFSAGSFLNMNILNLPLYDMTNQIILNFVVVASVFVYECSRENSNGIVSFIGFRRSNIMLYFVYSVVGFLVVVLFSSMLNFLFGSVTPPMPAFFENADFVFLRKVYLLTLIAAPFGEEIFFRGFLQNILTKQLGIKIGVFLSALLFAVLHTGYWEYSAAFLSVLFFGLALSFVRLQTHSLIPCIMIHLFNNLLAYTLLFN